MFLFPLIFAGLGLAVGSFLNLCMDRLPLGQSVIRPPSHCPTCHRRLSVRDLVPVFSYLWLRGRCRYCGAAIPPRLLVVELAMGLLFGFLASELGWGPKLGIVLAYVSLLSLLFVIDLEHQLILDRVVYPGMALALGFSWLWPGLSPARALAGGSLGLAALLLPYLLYRQGLGMGDIKLGGLVGLIAGYPLVFVALAHGFCRRRAGGYPALAVPGKKTAGCPPLCSFSHNGYPADAALGGDPVAVVSGVVRPVLAGIGME